MAKRAGLGDAWSGLMGVLVHSATAAGKVAQTADVLASIGLEKAENMREVVALEDAMSLAEIKSEQATRLAALKSSGIEIEL